MMSRTKTMQKWPPISPIETMESEVGTWMRRKAVPMTKGGKGVAKRTRKQMGSRGLRKPTGIGIILHRQHFCPKARGREGSRSFKVVPPNRQGRIRVKKAPALQQVNQPHPAPLQNWRGPWSASPADQMTFHCRHHCHCHHFPALPLPISSLP